MKITSYLLSQSQLKYSTKDEWSSLVVPKTAIEHWKLSSKQGKIGNRLICIIECVPILGFLVSSIERLAMKRWPKKESTPPPAVKTSMGTPSNNRKILVVTNTGCKFPIWAQLQPKENEKFHLTVKDNVSWEQFDKISDNDLEGITGLIMCNLVLGRPFNSFIRTDVSGAGIPFHAFLERLDKNNIQDRMLILGTHDYIPSDRAPEEGLKRVTQAIFNSPGKFQSYKVNQRCVNLSEDDVRNCVQNFCDGVFS